MVETRQVSQPSMNFRAPMRMLTGDVFSLMLAKSEAVSSSLSDLMVVSCFSTSFMNSASSPILMTPKYGLSFPHLRPDLTLRCFQVHEMERGRSLGMKDS